MKKKTIIHLSILAVALIAIIVLAIVLRNNDAIEGPYYATFMSLVPPIIAIALALITKEVYSSLFIGVLSAGLLYADFNVVKTFDAVVNEGIISAVSGTAGIFAFLVILGAIVVLLNKAGGSQAFGRWAQTHVKTRMGAMLATFALGVLIFVDDYFNCLTVGSVMRPVTDTHKISRTKLAYIIDATAAPICMIAPVSSWAAAVSEHVPDGQGIVAFVRAIPYNFYSLLTIVFVITIALIGFDYGKMRGAEIKAQKTGDLGAIEAENADEAEIQGNPKARVLDLILPIAVLIVSCITYMLYVGGFFTADSGCQWDLINAFGNTDATVALPLGSLVAFLIIAVYLIARRLITFKVTMEAIPKGFVAMVPAILILTLATALKNTTGLLGSDAFIKAMLANAGNLMFFLPAIIFIVACLLAFATGTSWGTFGILIPIVSAAFGGLDTEIAIIGMSACLAGAVCGDHCSPISDTTIMASAGAQCNHVEHVSTQLPYAITVAAVSFVAYIIAGALQLANIKWWVSLPIAIGLMIGTIFVIRIIVNKRKPADGDEAPAAEETAPVTEEA
ncbi:MAG: Na+/H+ antiporter NhaC family protein [Ruminococcaceae bacterium]|nr:Na+/H+ antiporter NhaC family protein [Oscillospiraceae bacterium]